MEDAEEEDYKGVVKGVVRHVVSFLFFSFTFHIKNGLPIESMGVSCAKDGGRFCLSEVVELRREELRMVLLLALTSTLSTTFFHTNHHHPTIDHHSRSSTCKRR